MKINKLAQFPSYNPFLTETESNRISKQRISEWTCKETRGTRYDYIGKNHLLEIGQETLGGNTGIQFKRNNKGCLYIPWKKDLFPSTGFAIALNFRVHDRPELNGETLIKARLYQQEIDNFFKNQNYEVGVIFSLQLTAKRDLRFRIVSTDGFAGQGEIFSSENFSYINPNVDYFTLIQFDETKSLMTLAIAPLHGNNLNFTNKTYDKPLNKKRIPILLGVQELGRIDPECPKGEIQKLGFYAPLTKEEIELIAWEFGVYDLNTGTKNKYKNGLDTHKITIKDEIIYFPIIKNPSILSLTEIDILNVAHQEIIQIIKNLNPLDNNLLLYIGPNESNVQGGTWTPISNADFIIKAKEHNTIQLSKEELTTSIGKATPEYRNYQDQDEFVYKGDYLSSRLHLSPKAFYLNIPVDGITYEFLTYELIVIKTQKIFPQRTNTFSTVVTSPEINVFALLIFDQNKVEKIKELYQDFNAFNVEQYFDKRIFGMTGLYFHNVLSTILRDKIRYFK